MQPSPYTPGEIARTVPGREEQLRQVDERLAYLSQVRRLVGRVRVDHGPRGVGKTSLLREYQRRAQSAGAQTIWVTAGDVGGLAVAITSELQRSAAAWNERDRRELAVTTHEFHARLGVPGIGEVGWNATRAADSSSSVEVPSGVREFEAVLKQATAGALKDERHSGLVIFVDEIQAADAHGLRTLGYAMQHFQAEAGDLPLAVFAVGLPESPDVIADAVTFSERFRYRPLGGLNEAATAVALAAPARDLGVLWASDALDAVVAAARGYPYAVQEFGQATWEAAGFPDPGGVLTLDHVRVGADDVAQSMETMFRARWSRATTGEKRLLQSMASLGDGPTRRAQIEQALGVDISDARRNLIDKGLIIAAGHGSLDFTVPGFAAWVRAEVATHGGESHPSVLT